MTNTSIDIRTCFDDPDLLPSTNFLHEYNRHTDAGLYGKCYQALANLKKEVVGRNDQLTAKAVWCLETIAKIQEHFITAFQRLCSGQFEQAWYQFARSEAESCLLRDHFADNAMEFGIAFIAAHTGRFQTLFPLSLGFSPELIVEEVRCSICDAKMTLRQECGHKNGDIYDGEMCVRNVTKAKLLGVAVVDKPAQRSTMIFPDEDQIDRFYPLQQLAQGLRSPWQAWNYREEERRSHHPAFKLLGPVSSKPWLGSEIAVVMPISCPVTGQS